MSHINLEDAPPNYTGFALESTEAYTYGNSLVFVLEGKVLETTLSYCIDAENGGSYINQKHHSGGGWETTFYTKMQFFTMLYGKVKAYGHPKMVEAILSEMLST